MSSKKYIYDILKELDIPLVSYGFSESKIFPKVVFFHVTSYHKRLSNKKKIKKHVYQINVYDRKPHDVETSGILQSIENAFENSMCNTGDWQEVINVNEDNNNEFMYFIEVYV